jgi:hypothetical protein
LEKLAYEYGSDKSRDDHAYTNVYQMIFDPIRFKIRNITEIGVAAGQSLQIWHKYFPNTEIHGFDPYPMESVQRVVESLGDRLHFHRDNMLEEPDAPHPSFLDKESMDIIIEDSTHDPHHQEIFLRKLWPVVQAGTLLIALFLCIFILRPILLFVSPFMLL